MQSSKLKRLNRKHLIEEIESLRQGFRTAIDFLTLPKTADRMSMEAYHLNANRIVVELGGESVYEQDDEKINEPKQLKLF